MAKLVVWLQKHVSLPSLSICVLHPRSSHTKSLVVDKENMLDFILQGPGSEKILSLETDLSSLITLVTIVFSMLKITRGLKFF